MTSKVDRQPRFNTIEEYKEYKRQYARQYYALHKQRILAKYHKNKNVKKEYYHPVFKGDCSDSGVTTCTSDATTSDSAESSG